MMKIKISENALVSAWFNLEQFRETYKASLDCFETEIKKNIVITKNALRDDETKIKNILFLGMAWGDVLLYVHEKDKFSIKLFNVQIKGANINYPFTHNVDTNEYAFRQKKCDVENLMIIHSLNNNIDYHLENFLKGVLFEYVAEKWQTITKY